MARKNVLLGDFLIEQGYITDQQLRDALKYHHENGVRIGRSLIDLGYISEQQMIKVLSEQLGVQYVNLKTYRIDRDVLDLVSAEMVWHFFVIPLFRIHERLSVAMVNPLDIFAIDALTRETHLRIEPVICSEVDIHDALEQHYPRKNGKTTTKSAEKLEHDEVTIIASGQEQQNTLEEIESLLEKLVLRNARQAFVIGGKLRVDLGTTYEDWPIAENLDRQVFMRLLCHYGDEVDSGQRETGRHLIQKQIDHKPVRFHISSSAGHNTDTLAIFVQMPRDHHETEENAAFDKLQATLKRPGGITLLSSSDQRSLDHRYYQLWQHVASVAKYPVSIEARPTTLVPDTVQLTCLQPSEQLAALRYAFLAGADFLFFKDTTDAHVLTQASHFARNGGRVVAAAVSHQPWDAYLPFAVDEVSSNSQSLLDSIYLDYPVQRLCKTCHGKVLAPQAAIAGPGEDVAEDDRCPQCHGSGRDGVASVQYLWSRYSADAVGKSEALPPGLGAFLKEALKKQLIAFLQAGEVHPDDLPATLMSYEK